MINKTCFKCGKTKLAIIERAKGETTPSAKIEMTMITYGKHKGEYRCKEC